MENLNAEQIKKALECCILGDCQGCFYGDTDQRHCKDDLMQNTLDLINRTKANEQHYRRKVQNQKEELKRLNEVVNRQEEEIERLKEKSIEDDKLLNDRIQEAITSVSKANQKYVDALENAFNDRTAELKTAKADYEALKEQEEKAHQYCKNVCEPKYKAEVEKKKEKISRLQNILIKFLNEMFEWGNKNNVDTTNFSTIPILENAKENITKQLKVEAYKEFANELKCRTHEISYNTAQVVTEYDIDNLLNELVGK